MPLLIRCTYEEAVPLPLVVSFAPMLRTHDIIARDARDAIPFADQIQRLGGLFSEADDAFRVFHSGMRSAKTKPSRSTVSPFTIGIGEVNIGPA